MKTAFSLLLALASSGTVSVALPSSAEPPPKSTAALSVGSQRQLSVDERIIARRTNARLSLHRPVDRGVVFCFDQPWESRRLVVNYATSAAGSITVELQDPAGRPIPGFREEEWREFWGNEIARVVDWQHGDDLSRLAGRTLRIRFVMWDADLYSFCFCP